MKLPVIAISVLAMVASSNTWAWGKTGHRVTGKIAESYLSESAKQHINALFPNSSLAEISTLADEMRSNPSTFWQKTASPWHYVSVPKGKSYSQVTPPSEGDAVTALNNFVKTIKDDAASNEDKKLALHFIVHIIGDLHQPLHAGNGTDRGGNDVKLKFFWEETNLHRVWDSQLIDKQQLSYSEMASWLNNKITVEQAQQWLVSDPNIWIKESTQLRDTIYPESDSISWDYQYKHIDTIKVRLQQGGVRIAAFLNKVFE